MNHTAEYICDNAQVGDLIRSFNEVMRSEPNSYTTYADGIYLVVKKPKSNKWLKLKLVSGSKLYWAERPTLFPHGSINGKYELLQ